MSNINEVLVFMHGITPNPRPSTHKEDYDSFEKRFKHELESRNKNYPVIRVDIEWGFGSGGTGATKDWILAPAEAAMFRQIREGIADKQHDLAWYKHPIRWSRSWLYNEIRKMYILGLTDMFYYVSEDGKEQVRQNAFCTILDHLPLLKEDEKYSLTIIAHSAGAVIMHDLLFIIFGGSSKSFLVKKEDQDSLDKLKDYARQGRVVVRCFVTMGAPVAPLVVRSNKLLDIFYHDGKFDGKLDLKDIGLCKEDKSKWLNFWSKDDILSCPAEFLYNNSDNLLEDCHVNVGKLIGVNHNRYWASDEVARIVADRY